MFFAHARPEKKKCTFCPQGLYDLSLKDRQNRMTIDLFPLFYLSFLIQLKTVYSTYCTVLYILNCQLQLLTPQITSEGRRELALICAYAGDGTSSSKIEIFQQGKKAFTCLPPFFTCLFTLGGEVKNFQKFQDTSICNPAALTEVACLVYSSITFPWSNLGNQCPQL